MSPFPGVPAYDVMTNPVMAASLEGPLGLARKPTPPAPAPAPPAGGGRDFVIASAAFNPLASSIDCMEAGLEALQQHSPSRSPSPVQPRKQARFDDLDAVAAAAGGPLRAMATTAAPRPAGPEPVPVAPPAGRGLREVEDEEVLKQQQKQVGKHGWVARGRRGMQRPGLPSHFFSC